MPRSGRERRSGFAPSPPVVERLVAPPPAPVAPPPAADPAAPPRDLEGELRQAFAGASACITPQTMAAVGTRLTVRVQIWVTPAGNTTRAEVDGEHLTPAERVCLEGRARAVQLGGPIAGAPRSVGANVQWDYAAPAAPAADEPPTPVVRPAGYVAPDRVMALPPAGPAPGAVAPGLTLPALAE